MCFKNKNLHVEFYYNNYEKAVKYVEEYMSKEHNIKLKVIGNQIIKYKNYLILGNTDKNYIVHVRYHITKSLFGEKIVLCYNDTFYNMSV